MEKSNTNTNINPNKNQNTSIDIMSISQKYFKLLHNERDLFYSDKTLYKYIENQELYTRYSQTDPNILTMNSFLEISLTLLSKPTNSKIEFIRLLHKIVNYLEKKKYIVTKQTNDNIIILINTFITESKTYLIDNNSNKLQKYYFSLINFIINTQFNSIRNDSLFNLLSTLLDYSLNSEKNTKLKGYSNFLIFKLVDNINDIIKERITEIMIISNYGYDTEILTQYINHFQENFYSGILNIQLIKSNQILDNMLNLLDSNNLFPYLNDEWYTDTDNDTYTYKDNNTVTEKRNTRNGRFGICSICGKSADFYCMNTKFSVCSLTCKNKVSFDDSFSLFLYYLQDIFINNKYHYYCTTYMTYINEIRKNLVNLFIKLSEEILNLDLLLEHNSKNTNISTNQFKAKFILDIFLKFFKYFSVILDITSFNSFKHILYKVVNKLLYLGDYSILSSTLELILTLIKTYGVIMRTEIKILLEEMIKILKSSYIDDTRSKTILKFFYLFLSLHNNDILFYCYYNFDCQIWESDIVKDLINVIISYIFNNEKDTSIKQFAIKLMTKLNRICMNRIKTKEIVYESNTEILDINKEVLRTKQNYHICKEEFNKNPKELVNSITSRHMKKEEESIEKFIAVFLRKQNGLDKEKIGEYFGKNTEFAKEILDNYLNTFNFGDVNIADALRKFLFCFKISGEGQIIDRIIDKFSLKYYSDNIDKKGNTSTYISNSDAAYYLSYNIIMLHTSIYNPNVNKKDRMNVQSFVKNLGGLNNGGNFDEGFLEEIYKNIGKNKFFISEFADILHNNKFSIITLDSLNLTFELSEESKWIYKSEPSTVIISITNTIFKSLMLDLENIILANSSSSYSSGTGIHVDKKFLISFFEYFVNFLELLDACNLVYEKVSLIKMWVKLIDFNTINEFEQKGMRYLKLFMEILDKKTSLFFIVWGHVISFIVKKHFLIETALASNTISDEELIKTLVTAYKLLSKEVIKTYFTFTLDFNSYQFIEFFTTLYDNLMKENEWNDKTYSFMLIYLIQVITNYNQKGKIWSTLIFKTKNMLSYILENKTGKGNKKLYTFIMKVIKLFLEQEENGNGESLSLLGISKNLIVFADIIFIILKNNDLDLKSKFKFLTILKENSKVLRKYIFESKLIETILNVIKTNDEEIKLKLFELTELLLIKVEEKDEQHDANNKLVTNNSNSNNSNNSMLLLDTNSVSSVSVGSSNNNPTTSTNTTTINNTANTNINHSLFNLLQNIFLTNFEFYSHILSVIIKEFNKKNEDIFFKHFYDILKDNIINNTNNEEVILSNIMYTFNLYMNNITHEKNNLTLFTESIILLINNLYKDNKTPILLNKLVEAFISRIHKIYQHQYNILTKGNITALLTILNPLSNNILSNFTVIKNITVIILSFLTSSKWNRKNINYNIEMLFNLNKIFSKILHEDRQFFKEKISNVFEDLIINDNIFNFSFFMKIKNELNSNFENISGYLRTYINEHKYMMDEGEDDSEIETIEIEIIEKEIIEIDPQNDSINAYKILSDYLFNLKSDIDVMRDCFVDVIIKHTAGLDNASSTIRNNFNVILQEYISQFKYYLLLLIYMEKTYSQELEFESYKIFFEFISIPLKDVLDIMVGLDNYIGVGDKNIQSNRNILEIINTYFLKKKYDLILDKSCMNSLINCVVINNKDLREEVKDILLYANNN